MNTIRVLPEKVASQIAAGEVIERPASVVRELLDNSIDAESDRIVIEIRGGGKGAIRVNDNGVGMSRDDLLLCLERHATSKITSVEDLFSIDSLGFRGEAIPSISSVSKTVITSRPADQLVGYRVSVSGGKLKSVEETGAPVGTTVAVRELFFNIPARRKFLRSVRTETDHIVDAVSRIALPFTGIHFRLDDEGKTILNLSSSENQLNRLSVLMGRDVARSMIEAHQEMNGIAITAYLASPDLSRTRGDRLFMYVNNRNVRDRLLTRAVMEGYGQRLMKGQYPQAVVFIETDPSLVDVNVHPTKQEIRFRQSRFVYQSVKSTIGSSLGGLFHAIDNSGPGRAFPRFQETSEEAHTGKTAVAETAVAYPGSAEKTRHGENRFPEPFLIKERLQIIGQLRDTYILCQASDGLVLIDQHAAHERILYETLKKSFQSVPLERQYFLLPLRLEFSVKEARLLEKREEQLVRLGLELEHFGGSTFLLRSAPSVLVGILWEEFFSELIPLLEEERDFTTDRALDRLLTIMACHGAIKAGKRMSGQEVDLILGQLEAMDLPTHCPHGRPVFKKLSYYDLEKMFKRVG